MIYAGFIPPNMGVSGRKLEREMSEGSPYQRYPKPREILPPVAVHVYGTYMEQQEDLRRTSNEAELNKVSLCVDVVVH
jgi:hypothetical protein